MTQISYGRQREAENSTPEIEIMSLTFCGGSRGVSVPELGRRIRGVGGVGDRRFTGV